MTLCVTSLWSLTSTAALLVLLTSDPGRAALQNYQDEIEPCKNSSEKVLTVAILLPSVTTDPNLHNLVADNSLEKVRPAIELLGQPESSYGGRSLQEILPGWRLKVVTGDTDCSSTLGPLRAFDFHCQAGLCSKREI